ncbi:MAG: MATE family efflux transporter [bacterium]|nr:MATE family efflux transporter [bacterium]
MSDEPRDPHFEESIIVPGKQAGSVGEAWKLAYPTVIGMMSATIMWTVDTMMLGRVGKVELAAAGFGGVLIWTLYTFFVGIVQGVSTFVAQAKGGGRLRECSIFAWQGLYLSLGAAALLSLFIWKMHWILDLAKPDPEVIFECLRYTRARLLGSFFLLATFVFHSFFRGIGDMKTPMKIALFSNAVNVVFDVVLIFGVGPFPRLTAMGAGAATAIADLSAALMGFILFVRPVIDRVYHTRTEHPFKPDAMKRLIRVGAPIGGQFFLDMGSFSIFMAAMGRLGTNQLAASQIGIQLLSFSFMPANGIAKAASTMVGQYIGAGKQALAERCAWVTVRMNLVYSLFIAVIFLVGRKHIFLAFNKDPEVVAAGMSIIPLLAVFQIGDALQMAFTNSLHGAGDTRFPMILIALSAYGIYIPLALLFAYGLGWGIVGGWLGGVIHFTVLSTVLAIRFRGGKWKTVTI